MENIANKTFDEERALYASCCLRLDGCSFDGPADGESALKESEFIQANDCFFNLRYPFWHNNHTTITNGDMTSKCRAALWYSKYITITNTKMHGIKALRECSDVYIEKCDIISPEFGWSVKNIDMRSSSAESEYFMLRAENLKLKNVSLNGKYSFQYIKNAAIEECSFNTKDAFWHAENVVIKNSIVKGEYLAWYSKNITFENCKIIGTQPLCYCQGLKLINCEMIDTDLCFEKSEVEATITSPVISIKNPSKGKITVPSVNEIIRNEKFADAEIIIK